METFVIHPKDQEQQKALQTFLEGSHIPYENEPGMDETTYLLSSETNAKRLKEAIQEESDGKGKKFSMEELNSLWK
jgi:hypothetical protein